MDAVTIGARHVRSLAAEELYLRLGYDLTRPVTFSGLVNERCNVKCRYCAYWRLEQYQQEMTIEQWQDALLSIKTFVGPFTINFSGGEPFIKPGFLDLLAWCHDAGIRAGVTTNGSALTARNVKKLVAARPFNLNVSVDAPDAETHDFLRGYPGLFDRLRDGIAFVRAEQQAQAIRFPIMIKPTLTAGELPVRARHGDLGQGHGRDLRQLPAAGALDSRNRRRALDLRRAGTERPAVRGGASGDAKAGWRPRFSTPKPR